MVDIVYSELSAHLVFLPETSLQCAYVFCILLEMSLLVVEALVNEETNPGRIVPLLPSVGCHCVSVRCSRVLRVPSSTALLLFGVSGSCLEARFPCPLGRAVAHVGPLLSSARQ